MPDVVSIMEEFFIFDHKGGNDTQDDPVRRLLGADHPQDKKYQVILSVALGITAFLSFCFLRLKWTSLYAARKRLKNEASILPELPKTLFGWIIPLFRINDQQILASAGLDAYVFLAFFKLAMKFLTVTFLFSLIVIKPVHDAIPDDDDDDAPGSNRTLPFRIFEKEPASNHTGRFPTEYLEDGYLWMYVVFVYLFSAIAAYLIITETRRIIALRQEYLGTQTSMTDRTMRLSGIPADLQDEARIKEFIEELDIGRVQSVTLCRNWKELDEAVAARVDTLRKVEEAYTIHLGYKRVGRNSATLPISQPTPPGPQPVDLLNGDPEEQPFPADANVASDIMPYARARPTINLWHGRLNLKRRKVDAIDHYEAKLKEIDQKVEELRRGTFAPTPLAFVTMDSVAACQMAIQAVLDPSPQQLIANQSPSPADIIWQNTYLTRRSRMLRSWSITALILFLTVFWFVILAPIILTLSSEETLRKFFPHLKELMDQNEFVGSLIGTQIPILLTSLLMVLVPYLYYWLSSYQGMISQRDVELSAISKNFFFTFFNIFIMMTVVKTASNFYDFYKQFGDVLTDVSKVAYTMAQALQRNLDFYVNLVILQGIGLFPFRLLEMGSVSLYPVYRIGAKTPRDYAELVQPPVFSYAFYLPNALLIFIICMVYSVLRSSWQILLAGLIFFAFGHFVYKYQLLYAMDHGQQAGGQAWSMICDRLFIGMIFFQVSTAGQLGLKGAVARSAMVIPLIIATVWVAIIYGKTYKPLLKYIALRSVKRGEQYTDNDPPPEDPSLPNSTSSSYLGPEHNVWADNDGSTAARQSDRQRGRIFDESNDAKLGYVNPSLVVPLEKVWIADQIDQNEEGIVDVDNNDGAV